MWKMVDVELVVYSFKNSITASGVITGPCSGIVTLEPLSALRRSAILVMYKVLPIPDRVELTILTQNLETTTKKNA